MGTTLDTTPDAYAAQLDAYRRMEGRERSAIMFRLGETTRRTTMAGIRHRHPEYDDTQVRMALARLLELNPSLDHAYVERWAADLGVSDLWLDILSRR